MRFDIPFTCPHETCGKGSIFLIQQDFPFAEGETLESVKKCPKCQNKLLFRARFRNGGFEHIETQIMEG